MQTVSAVSALNTAVAGVLGRMAIGILATLAVAALI